MKTKNDMLTRAMLVNLSISQYNPVRSDRKTTREVLTERHAGTAAGKWIKNLIDPDALRGITNAASDARRNHYELTLPWMDGGWRILPTEIYFRYQEAIAESKAKFDGLVDEFVEAWPKHVEDARTALNGMFDERQYPTQDSIRSAFAMRIDFAPMPCSSDFRITMADGELDKIRRATDDRIAQAREDAMRDLWNRLADPLRAVAEKLSTDDAVFRDSLIGNMKQIVDIVPAMNLGGNGEIAAFAAEINERIAIADPDRLRKRKEVRRDTAEAATEILKRMEGYLS